MVLKSIINRRSVRSYKSETVPDELITKIIEAAQYAPTANNNRSIEFIIVKDSAMKENIYNVVSREFIKQAPLLVVPVIDTRKSVAPVEDLSIASSHIFLQAAEYRLGSVWKNIIEPQTTEIKKLLHIPDYFMLINVIPIGYSSQDMAAHSSAECDYQKIHYERW